MADEILKDMTQLGSKLAEMATNQLDDVLSEIKGPVGGSRDEGQSANVGTLAFKVLQAVSRLGELATELAKYDLVRSDKEKLTMSSANALSSITFRSNTQGHEYHLFIENDGRKDRWQLKLEAKLLKFSSPSEPSSQNVEAPALPDLIAASERRRVTIKLQPLAAGEYNLMLSLYSSESSVCPPTSSPTPPATKKVLIKVLPPPEPPTP